MLTIRLSRTGRNNVPYYSIFVTEKTNPSNDGNFLEKVGTYSPTKEELTLEKERIEYWISKGAQVSETLARMLHKQGYAGMDRFVDFKKKFNKKNKNAPVAAAPGAPAPAAA